MAAAGGYPGLQLQDPDELNTVLKTIHAQGADEILERMWFCPHAYGANHPPNYPYDTVNLRDHPGTTIVQDSETVLGFLAFAPVFGQEIGFVPPFIVAGGGWHYQSHEDLRYPAIDENLHAQNHASLFESFCTGRLPNGEPTPDYLFSFCPWILFGGEADAWYSWTLGTRRQTIVAVQSLPTFVRTFRWDNSPSKKLGHYVLFGQPKDSSTRSMMVGARKYLHQFGPMFGFNVFEAMYAQRVTIVGDTRRVAASEERQLRDAGCRVERLNGDQYKIDAILADRVARKSEYG